MPLFVTVTPGTTVTNSTTLDATTLNLLGTPSVDVVGTVDGGSLTLSDGSVTTSTLASNAVTFAKMQAVTANRLLGNDGTGTAIEEITPDSTNFEFGSGTFALKNRGVSAAKLFEVTTKKLLGRNATTNGDVQQITVGTGLTLSDDGTLSVSASVKTWTSAELTVPAAGATESITFASTTLGGAPDIVAAYLKCVDAGGDVTYALNDTVELRSVISDSGEVEVPGFGIYLNSTSINVLGITGNIMVPNKTTGVYAYTIITKSKWRLIVKLLKFG